MNPKKKISIFIVEDNNVFTLALKANIENAFVNIPVKIHSFETGEECMKKFKEEKPKVVILDYHLNSNKPDAADGIKVLDMIKKENHETNVIMLTGDDDINIAVNSFKHGACDYVVKTETQFQKINYSLFNLFRILKSKKDAGRYKHMVVGVILFFVLVIGGLTAIQIFAPSILR
jgi:DNA-binding NtrC family response regulator